MTTATASYPVLHADSPQHMRSLRHANEVRLARAAACRHLRYGERAPHEVFEDPAVASMYVHDLLLNVPPSSRVLRCPPEDRHLRSIRGRSNLQATKLVKVVGCSPFRRVRDLTQREVHAFDVLIFQLYERLRADA